MIEVGKGRAAGAFEVLVRELILGGSRFRYRRRRGIHTSEWNLSRNPDTSGPLNGHATLGNYHDPTMARQVHLEQRLDEARNAGVPVANLNVEVIDHWHQKGWYNLFKKRYVDDGYGASRCRPGGPRGHC